MKTIVVTERLSKDEHECLLSYSEVDNKWCADVSVAKLRTKFVKKGWTETSQTVLEDGTWQASTFEAPYHAVSIRSPEKRELSEEQKQAIRERFAKTEIKIKI